MLKRLSIRNYALIENTEVALLPGMTIITGETGAGKSILLGALALISGQRADTGVLFDPSQKCFVEAEFNIDGYKLENFFERNELDFARTTLIRREISADGKSRAFINDTPVNLNTLKELTSGLLDIHSQHETLLLNREDFQISIIDSYSDHAALIANYQALFRETAKVRQKLTVLKEQQDKNLADKDYFEFQLQELLALGLENANQQQLEEECNALTHAAEIAAALEKTDFLINGNEVAVLTMLNEIMQSLQPVGSYYSPVLQIQERIRSLQIELKDISSEVQLQTDKIVVDPLRLEEITSRLNQIYALQKKHRVNDIPALIAIRDELDAKIGSITGADEETARLEKVLEENTAKLETMAAELSANRKAAITRFEKDVASLLTEVSLPNAVLKVSQALQDKLNANGKDDIEFLFSANKGTDFRPLSKTASGGELSRLMLCIKALSASLVQLPTLIFDEIDTGISGEVAQKVGKVIAELSGKLQLIAITHLPQIAGRGNHHLYVYKENSGPRTHSRIKMLSPEERIVEIAKMLSGETPTEAALQNARELLKV